MAKTDEDKISTWLDQHAAISIAQHDDPRALERELIAAGPSLPLNLDGSSHPFRQTLSAMRQSLGRADLGPKVNPDA